MSDTSSGRSEKIIQQGPPESDPEAGDWAHSVINGANRTQTELAVGYVDNPFYQYDPAIIPYAEQPHPTAVLGQTGSGTTTLLTTAMEQMALNGHGACFVDPTGDATHDILARLPDERLDDVIVLGATADAIIGVNLLHCETNTQVELEELVETVKTLLKTDDWSKRMDLLTSVILRELIEAETAFTLADLYYLLAADDAERNQYANKYGLDQTESYLADNDEIAASLATRLKELIADPDIRKALSPKRTDINLQHAVENEKIIIIQSQLANPQTTEYIISGLTRKLWVHLRTRDAVTEQQTPFFLLIDDFNTITDLLSPLNMFARAQSLGIGIWAGITDFSAVPREIKSGVIGNSKNLIAFNPGDMQVANEIVSRLTDTDRSELLDLNPYTARARLHAPFGRTEVTLHLFPPSPERRTRKAVANMLTEVETTRGIARSEEDETDRRHLSTSSN